MAADRREDWATELTLRLLAFVGAIAVLVLAVEISDRVASRRVSMVTTAVGASVFGLGLSWVRRFFEASSLDERRVRSLVMASAVAIVAIGGLLLLFDVGPRTVQFIALALTLLGLSHLLNEFRSIENRRRERAIFLGTTAGFLSVGGVLIDAAHPGTALLIAIIGGFFGYLALITATEHMRAWWRGMKLGERDETAEHQPRRRAIARQQQWSWLRTGLALLTVAAYLHTNGDASDWGAWAIVVIGLATLIAVSRVDGELWIIALMVGLWWTTVPKTAEPMTTPLPPAEVELDDSAGPSTTPSGGVLLVFGDSYISGEGANAYLADTNVRGGNECRRSTSAHHQLLAIGAGRGWRSESALGSLTRKQVENELEQNSGVSEARERDIRNQIEEENEQRWVLGNDEANDWVNALHQVSDEPTDRHFDRVAAERLELPTHVISVACSGAVAANIEAEAQYDPQPALRADSNVPPQKLSQIGLAEHYLRETNEDVEMILISLGGNDALFSTLITSCLGPGNCAEIGQYFIDQLEQFDVSTDEEVAEPILSADEDEELEQPSDGDGGVEGSAVEADGDEDEELEQPSDGDGGVEGSAVEADGGDGAGGSEKETPSDGDANSADDGGAGDTDGDVDIEGPGRSLQAAYSAIKARFVVGSEMDPIPTDKAPRVLVVPYPQPLASQTCSELFTAQEHLFLNDFVRRLNGKIEALADHHGFEYVTQTETAFDEDGRLCGESKLRDREVNFLQLFQVGGELSSRINPLSWVHNTAHPNESGHASMATAILDYLLLEAECEAPSPDECTDLVDAAQASEAKAACRKPPPIGIRTERTPALNADPDPTAPQDGGDPTSDDEQLPDCYVAVVCRPADATESGEDTEDVCTDPCDEALSARAKPREARDQCPTIWLLGNVRALSASTYGANLLAIVGAWMVGVVGFSGLDIRRERTKRQQDEGRQKREERRRTRGLLVRPRMHLPQRRPQPDDTKSAVAAARAALAEAGYDSYKGRVRDFWHIGIGLFLGIKAAVVNTWAALRAGATHLTKWVVRHWPGWKTLGAVAAILVGLMLLAVFVYRYPLGGVPVALFVVTVVMVDLIDRMSPNRTMVRELTGIVGSCIFLGVLVFVLVAAWRTGIGSREAGLVAGVGIVETLILIFGRQYLKPKDEAEFLANHSPRQRGDNSADPFSGELRSWNHVLREFGYQVAGWIGFALFMAVVVLSAGTELLQGLAFGAALAGLLGAALFPMVLSRPRQRSKQIALLIPVVALAFASGLAFPAVVARANSADPGSLVRDLPLFVGGLLAVALIVGASIVEGAIRRPDQGRASAPFAQGALQWFRDLPRKRASQLHSPQTVAAAGLILAGVAAKKFDGTTSYAIFGLAVAGIVVNWWALFMGHARKLWPFATVSVLAAVVAVQLIDSSGWRELGQIGVAVIGLHVVARAFSARVLRLAASGLVLLALTGIYVAGTVNSSTETMTDAVMTAADSSEEAGANIQSDGSDDEPSDDEPADDEPDSSKDESSGDESRGTEGADDEVCRDESGVQEKSGGGEPGAGADEVCRDESGVQEKSGGGEPGAGADDEVCRDESGVQEKSGGGEPSAGADDEVCRDESGVQEKSGGGELGAGADDGSCGSDGDEVTDPCGGDDEAAGGDDDSETDTTETKASFLDAMGDGFTEVWRSVFQALGLDDPPAPGPVMLVVLAVVFALIYRQLENVNARRTLTPVAVEKFTTPKAFEDGEALTSQLQSELARAGITEPPFVPTGGLTEEVIGVFDATPATTPLAKVASKLAVLARPKRGTIVVPTLEYSDDDHATVTIRVKLARTERILYTASFHGSNPQVSVRKAVAFIARNTLGASVTTPAWAKWESEDGLALRLYLESRSASHYGVPISLEERTKRLKTAIAASPSTGLTRVELGHVYELGRAPWTALRIQLEAAQMHPRFVAAHYRVATGLSMLAGELLAGREPIDEVPMNDRIMIGESLKRVLDRHTNDNASYLEPADLTRRYVTDTQSLGRDLLRASEDILGGIIAITSTPVLLLNALVHQDERNHWTELLRTREMKAHEVGRYLVLREIIKLRRVLSSALTDWSGEELTPEQIEAAKSAIADTETIISDADRYAMDYGGAGALYNHACLLGVYDSIVTANAGFFSSGFSLIPGEHGTTDQKLRASTAECRQHAIELLYASRRHLGGGFPGLRWIEADPDLHSLRNEPLFKQLLRWLAAGEQTIDNARDVRPIEEAST